jgi:polyhydroxybutyrate depolymerase
VLLPNGTPGGLEPSTTRQFWNAGGIVPAIDVDDVAYLRGLIAEAIAVRPIDPDRVYVFGHSNGGIMAYRLACELSGEVTAIAALASPMVMGFACEPTHPVSVLSLHGDADEVVFYEGGSTFGNYGSIVLPQPPTPYRGAVEQIALWADWFGCDAQPVAGGRLNLMAGVAGDETAVTVHEGCPQGIDVQLDTIEGGTHVPALIQQSVGTDILDWLLAHTG